MNKRGIIKIGAGIFILLLVLALVFSSLFSSAAVKSSYVVGEEIKMDLSQYESCSLKIKTPSSTLIQPYCNDKFSFKLEEAGEYTIDIKSADSSERMEFQVSPRQETEEWNIILFNFTTDNTYLLNNTLKFDMNSLGNYELIIFTPSGKRISRVSTNDVFIFSLTEEGMYDIKFERGNRITHYNFRVVSKHKQDLIQKKAEINKPVEWNNVIDTIEAKESNNLIEIPSVTNLTLETANGESFTDYVLTNIDGKNYISINENLSEDISVKYFTEAPIIKEQAISENMKEVVVSSPSDVHYEDVISYTQLPKEIIDRSLIKVYWKENNTYLDFEAFDKDGNGLLDYIEWVVPHLSNQTFEIIIITKAEHLSSNKTFISDIYSQVRKLDDMWSETINSDEYVRIIFERNLTSSNDITIFPRIALGNPIIEVYEKDSTIQIAEFNPIIGNDYNKVLLTNLQGSQDTFDLKVVGGSVQFDYIVDPLAVYNASLGAPTCSVLTSPCIANSSLLRCVGSQAAPGPETNAPNSIDACTDSPTSGTCYSDESVENITITDLNSTTFTGGDTVNVTVSWYCYGTMDRIALYYTSSTSSINWQNQLAGTTTCPAAGYYTRNITFTLDNVPGPHAVRAIMLYNAVIPSACPTGSYRDQDDLVFQVAGEGNFSTSYYNMNPSHRAYWGQPTSSNRWAAGTNATIGQYNNMKTENGVYAVNAMAGGTNNDEPFWRFNFTVDEEVSQISSLSVKFTGFSNASGGESAYLYIYNVNSTWMRIGTLPTSNGNLTYTITNNIRSYMNMSNHQILLVAEGENFDAGYALVVDHVGLTVQYTLDETPPSYSQVSVNNTYAGQITNFAINITDETTLDPKGQYIFSTNNTGSWVNDTAINFTTTPSWANTTEVLNSVAGTIVGYIWYFDDGSGNTNSTPIYTLTTTDGIPPTFTTIPSNSSLFYGNQSLLVKFTGTDETGFGYYRVNDTRFSINQTGFLSNATPMAVGNYEINVSINDTSNNINWTRYKVQVNKSNYFDCGVYFNTTTPQTYPYNFITYTNCSSTYTLYRNGTAISNASTINAGAGYYNLTVQRTDTANYTNTIMSRFFTVNKNTENCRVLFNETSPLSYPRPFIVWANCTTPFTLMRNGTTISNNSVQNLVGGAYNFSFTRTDTVNYTTVYNQSQFIVNPDSGKPYFTTIPSNSSLFYGNQSLLVKFTATDAIGFGYYFTNDTRFLINQTGFLRNASPIAVGNYEINVSINDTSNNINWTRYKVQVNKSQENCRVLFNVTSPINFPDTFTVWANCTSAFVLRRNGTVISNNSVQSLSAGAYNFSMSRNDTLNYTVVYNQSQFIVNPPLPVGANQIQCEQGGSWKDCNQVDFAEVLTRVRVNCTGGYINASFNLTNIPDRFTLLYANATSVASGFLIYDNPDLTINDSGQFILNSTCYGAGSQSFNSTNWNVSWGNISVTLINPNANVNVNHLEFFNFTAQVSCIGGECGFVNATLDPENWWNYSWLYRTPINISGVGTQLTDFQIQVSKNLTEVYNRGNLKSDCSDIRFANSTSNEIPYWIESCDISGGNSSFWVKVPSIAASGSTIIYMYYGNPSASSVSNGTTTFDYFDSGNNVGTWTVAGTAGQTSAQGLPQPSYYATSNSGNYIYKNIGLTTNRILEYDARSDGLGNLFFLTNSAGNGQHFRLETRDTYPDGTGIAAASTWTTWSAPFVCDDLDINTWYNFRLVIGSTTAQAYINNVSCGGAYTFSNNGGYIGLVGDGLGGGYNTWWDNFKVRKYSSSTPVYSLNNEENGVKGVIPMNSGVPFYTTSKNPMNYLGTSCLSDMKSGKVCNVTWAVNATGEIGSIWEFYVFAYNTNYTNYFNTTKESSRINITIGNLPPSTPELNLPANASSLSSIGQFNWSNSLDPTGDNVYYIFEVSNSSTFSYINYRNGSISQQTEPTGDIPTGIVNEGSYYWRVRATDLKSNSSWSETRVFYYDLSAPNVTLWFPANNHVNTTSNTFDFKYSVSDTSNIINCSLIINNTINVSSVSINKSTNMTLTTYLPNSFYIWGVNCTDQSGRTGASENRNLTLAVLNNPPVAREIQCEKNSVWYNCSSIGFGDNLTRVRVRCTDPENGIVNATFNLTNMPDGYNYLLNTTTYSSGNYWILNNSNKIINDSGDFSLIATCYDSDALSNSNYTTWAVPWGSLLIDLLDPSSDSYAMRYQFFNFTARVNCTGGECGDMNVTLDPANWWNDSWDNRKTINVTNFGSTVLSNFTIYINLTKESEMQNDFDDIRFANGSCGSSGTLLLNYELENYTSSRANVWVKIPSLATGINQICMYYGNPSAVNGQNKQGTWNSNYKMVLHISESGTGTRYDSTPNVNNGTPTNYDGPEHVNGKIDGADQLLSDDYINTNYLQSGVTQYTISAWINTASTTGTIVQDRGTGAGQSITFGIYPPCGGGGCTGASAGIPGIGVDSNSIWIGSYGTSRVDDGNWHYVVGVFNSTSGSSVVTSNFRIYVDGRYESGSSGSTGSVTSPITGLSGTKIGYHEAWAGNYFNGYIDEVTIATTAFSNDWINQSYQMVQNQNNSIGLGEKETRSKGILSTVVGAMPFYTTTHNPLNSSTTNCLANMKQGNTCNLTWSINATGALNSVWEFFVSANNLNYTNYFNTSTDSAIIDITIASQLAPTVPQLYRPLNATAFPSIPNLNWTNSTDINGDKIYYILQVSNVSDFSTISFANYSIPETANPTGKTPTGISTQGAYYWRVRATDLIANSSWSETRVFYYDLSAPNLTFINQTGEDNRIINFSNWLNRGENMTIFVNSSDVNVDKVWIIVWSTVVGGVEKVKTFFTYVGGFLWMAKVSTNQAWEGLYNYTIYTNDTLGLQTNYTSNFTVLGGNATIRLNPSSMDIVGNVSTYGHINLTNSTNLSNYPINLWLNGSFLFLSNLTGEGTYDFYKEFLETSSAEFSQGAFYQTEIQGNQNITLSSGMTSGNFTKTLDAGAMVSWNNLSWDFEGASCSGVLSYQDGDSNSYSGTRDAYISSGFVTTNYGSVVNLSIDGSPYSERGLIKFDGIIGRAFNQIPENSTINDANLTFQVSDNGNPVDIYAILENWTESAATYNQRLTGTSWSSSGCSGDPSRSTNLEDSSVTNIGAQTINVSNSLKNWAAGSSQNYGWVFDMPTSNGILISSRESPTQSERPLLMVDYQANECTNIIVYIRTSNNGATWTSWREVSNGDLINDSNIYSRYLQYRVEFTSVNPSLTPVLKDITVNYTAIVTDSNGDYRYNFTNPAQFGAYNIVVNTSLKTILMNSSAILSVQTGVAPNVSLITPNNSQWFSYGNMNLTYNATDFNNNFASSKLIINGVLNQTNTTPITNYAYNNFTINFSSGQYNWTVNVTDTTGYETTTSQRTFYIDLINPNISLVYPDNQSVFTVNQLNLSFNATDNMDTNLTCSIVLDGNTIRSGIGAASGNITNVSSGTLVSGKHYWNVTCTDNAIRNFTSSTFNFNISDTPPNVTLVSPYSNYLDGDGNIFFIFNASDNTGFINCSLIINGNSRTWNQSAILNNQNNTFDISGLSEGRQNWTVECFDLSSTSNKPSPRNFSVDLYAPTIALSAPSNSGTSLFSRVYFNFTVNDTIDSSLNCNLTIDGAVRDTFNASSGNQTNRSISNLTDGLKSWNVTCVDDALHSNTSATWTVNITVAPSISLYTSNNSRYNQSSINLTYIPYDNTNLSSCRLYLNGALNQSNSTLILNNQSNNFTLNGIPEGTYNWYVNCSDYYGLSNQSITRVFYIDRSPPVINVSYPRGDGVFASNVTFNFTVTDSVDMNLSCNITVNSSVVATNFTASNGSMTSKIVSGISDGYHIWNVTCWDIAGNVNTSSTFNFTRYTNPQVSLTSPDNNTWFNSSLVTLFYLPEDDEGIVSSSLFINGVFNRTNSSPIINHNYNNFSINGFSDGIYYWNVNVTDPTGLTGIGVERKIYIDSQKPSLTLNSPNQSAVITTNNVTFNFSILDNLDGNLDCNFTLDGEQESSGIYSNNSNVLKYAILGDGNHSWNIDCADNASNINNSDVITFTVEAPPIVTLNLPANSFRTTSSSVLFNYTPLDPIGLPNCSIYLDGVYNSTKTDILFFTNMTGRLNNFTINGIAEGIHSWTVNCTDSDNNDAGASPFTFYRDLSPPSIILNSPDNNSGIDYNKDRVYFNWTGIDVLDNTLQCNLTVDGIVREPNVWISNGTPMRKYVFTSVMGQGEHSWTVTCWDQLKNSNTSELRKFNLTYPDFFINSSDIILNETNPKENQSVIINATIYNLAGSDIENITVMFYNGDPDIGGTKIGTDVLINLSKFNQTTISKNWVAPIGASQVFVLVDTPLATNGSFKELNESNNKAGKNFNVGSWQFFYGDVLTFSEDVLANSNESKLIAWGGDGFNGGNVYVTDYDSFVAWNNLQAIGKTKLNADSSSDFAEIDSTLNSSAYVDSVYSVYTNSGTAKGELNLSSFGKFIQEVPVVNSTNNSNFVTGILWDYSDDIVDGEFDSVDKEDMVFVAPINKHAEGTYGIYDYEIRVPAKLREYKSGDSKAALFYVELS